MSDDAPDEDTATYRVPVMARGVVYVTATDAEDAVAEAKDHAGPDDLQMVFDANHAEMFRVEPASDDHVGTVANAAAKMYGDAAEDSDAG